MYGLYTVGEGIQIKFYSSLFMVNSAMQKKKDFFIKNYLRPINKMKAPHKQIWSTCKFSLEAISSWEVQSSTSQYSAQHKGI